MTVTQPNQPLIEPPPTPPPASCTEACAAPASSPSGCAAPRPAPRPAPPPPAPKQADIATAQAKKKAEAEKKARDEDAKKRAAAKAGQPWETGKAFDGSAPLGAIVPTRFRCQPGSASDAQHIAPRFTSLVYGTPAYAQLARSTPPEVLRGADEIIRAFYGVDRLHLAGNALRWAVKENGRAI